MMNYDGLQVILYGVQVTASDRYTSTALYSLVSTTSWIGYVLLR